MPGLIAVLDIMCFKFSYMTATKAVVPGVWTMVYVGRMLRLSGVWSMRLISILGQHSHRKVSVWIQ